MEGSRLYMSRVFLKNCRSKGRCGFTDGSGIRVTSTALSGLSAERLKLNQNSAVPNPTVFFEYLTIQDKSCIVVDLDVAYSSDGCTDRTGSKGIHLLAVRAQHMFPLAPVGSVTGVKY